MEIIPHFYLLGLILVSIILKAVGDAKKDQTGKRLHYIYDISVMALLGFMFIVFYYSIHPVLIVLSYVFIRAGIFNFFYNNFRTDVKFDHIGTTAGFDIILDKIGNFIAKISKKDRTKKLIKSLTVHVFYLVCVFGGLILTLDPRINNWFMLF